MWRYLEPLRNKIIFWLICTALLLAVFCVPLWHVWTGTILTGRIESLHLVAERLHGVAQKRGIPALAAEIDDWVGNDSTAYGQLLLLVAPDGKRMAGNLQAAPRATPDASGLYLVQAAIGTRQAAVELIVQDLQGGYRIWVGRDMTRFERLEGIFVRGMIGTALITLMIAFAATWSARRAMLARIDMTNRTMAGIVEGDLSHRLHESHSGDEFDVLAHTVNGMLEQLDVLVQNVKHASNAIAHDLRTPLAELRGDLEQLLVMQPPPDEVMAGVEVAIADVDRVIGIFNAILRLAEIDSGTRRAGFKLIDASAVLEEAAEFYEPVAEELQIKLETSCAGELLILGDAVLLAQAIGNLVDNAFKYGAGKNVALVARRGANDTVEIVVADHGAGIPAAEIGKVVDRFYRLDPGRSSPGVGLGLALVNAVAKLHGGTLQLQDNQPGLRAVLTIAEMERP